MSFLPYVPTPRNFSWLSGVGLSDVMFPKNFKSLAVAERLYGNPCKAQYPVRADANGRSPPSTPLMGTLIDRTHWEGAHFFGPSHPSFTKWEKLKSQSQYYSLIQKGIVSSLVLVGVELNRLSDCFRIKLCRVKEKTLFFTHQKRPSPSGALGFAN